MFLCEAVNIENSSGRKAGSAGMASSLASSLPVWPFGSLRGEEACLVGGGRAEAAGAAVAHIGALRATRPLYVRSRRPLVASLTRLTRCSITVYCTKREMPEIGSMGARAPEKEVDVDNAPTRGYQPQPVAPRRAPRCLAPVVGAKGGGLVAILNLT